MRPIFASTRTDHPLPAVFRFSRCLYIRVARFHPTDGGTLNFSFGPHFYSWVPLFAYVHQLLLLSSSIRPSTVHHHLYSLYNPPSNTSIPPPPHHKPHLILCLESSLWVLLFPPSHFVGPTFIVDPTDYTPDYKEIKTLVKKNKPFPNPNSLLDTKSPTMTDYGAAISLSQAHTSDDESSEHSPRSVPTLSTTPPTASSSKLKTRAISTVDHHHHHHRHHNLQSPVDTSRKPRGRPPGSKNKPKPPIIITKDNDSAMKPAVLEISAGSCVIESIINYARRHQAGISIISASGSVSSVTLRHPLSHAPSLSLHGPFNLLSLCGSFLGSSKSALSLSSSCSFGITLAGAQGQVFGGIVAGKVVAATAVLVVAATFVNPMFHRLPSDGGDDDGDAEETKPSVVGGANECCPSTSMSMSVYGVPNPAPINCQMPPPDVMPWGPTSRPPY